MTKPRDWDWIPHLLVCYAVLFCLWMAVGLVGFLMFGCDPAYTCTERAPAQEVVARILHLAFVVIPALGIAATVRVALNEQRWRREASMESQDAATSDR